MQSITITVVNLIFYVGFFVIMILICMSLAWIRKLNFRMLKLKKSIFFFKWALWFVELVYFPVLLNIIQFSTCQYSTQKLTITVINCSK